MILDLGFLSDKFLIFITCFKKFKIKTVFIKFINKNVIFIYDDTNISILYYFSFFSNLNCCISIDFSFLIKVLTNLSSFNILIDFKTRKIIFNSLTFSYENFSFLNSNYSYSFILYKFFFSFYIESHLFFNPVFLPLTNLTFKNYLNNFYIFNSGYISYLSYDEFRILLVRKTSLFLNSFYCFSFCFNILPLIFSFSSSLSLGNVLLLIFNKNIVRISTKHLLFSTFISTSLSFKYRKFFIVNNNYCFLNICKYDFFCALNYIRLLNCNTDCEFFIDIFPGYINIFYSDSIKGNLISTLKTYVFNVRTRICLNLGFCLDFLSIFPENDFLFSFIDSNHKVYMLSNDLYSYIYCLIPISIN